MKKNLKKHDRRQFLGMTGLGMASFAMPGFAFASGNSYSPQEVKKDLWEENPSKGWHPLSDRKIRVGLVGYGASKFSASFGFQDHPNVEVYAVSDLFPDRCAELAKVTRCKKTYASLEELVKDDKIEAVFVATDAPGHVRHCMEVLRHGKHVAVAVPAVFGSLEDADRLYEAVKQSGMKYMMFETSCFRGDNYAMRQIYNSGGFGKIVYAEGEYFHGPSLTPAPPPKPGVKVIPTSYMDWRVAVIPQWYPTHSNAYYVGVTGGSFTDVSCLGMESYREINKGGNNQYKNPFSTEIALFRTNEGGMARMGVSWDTPGFGGEVGRIRGQKGSYYGKYEGLEKNLPDLNRPPLPPSVKPGGHGGSHGPLTNEFVLSILEDRKPLVDIAMSLNMTVAGVVAHQSAMKGGEWMKVPQYKL